MKGVGLVFVVGDLHAGSSVGLLAPGFETIEGQAVTQNAVQQFLWSAWTHATQTWLPKIAGGDKWALVVNGDLLEGVHHGTKQVISPDPADHARAAELILEPLVSQAAKSYIILGTESHTGSSAEHNLGRGLKCQRDPNTGKFAWDRLDLTVNGCRCVFRHHITTSLRTWTEAMGLGAALANEQVEAAKNGESLPRVLCCAHRHRYGEFKDASGVCVVTPPFQALTRFGHKVCPSARTRPGIVALDWRGKESGDLPEVKAMTYRPPEAKGATL